MRYEISGNIMQTVAIDLAPGETVYSQTNTMAWMNDQVTMDTHTGGGFFAGLQAHFRRRLVLHHRFHRERRRAMSRSRRAFPARSCPRCCSPANR